MLRNKRFIACILFGLFCICGIAAQTSSFDLSDRYLNKAEEALDDGNLDAAYKNINLAMKVTKTGDNDIVPTNVLILARTIYKAKLKAIQQKYDEPTLIEIKTNLEQFPEVTTAEITKLVRQIEASKIERDKAADKKDQQDFYDRINEANEATNNAVREMKEQSQQTNEYIKEQGERQIEQQKIFTEQMNKTNSNFSKILILIVAIIVIILLVVVLIVVIVRAAAKHSQIQQQQYVEAFKMLAASQNQTNQLMIGGITGLYSNDGLKLAGASTWSQSALPEPEETPEEKEELRELAAKCEDLGAKIDQVTGRKNNSKNVSEIVYKISMRLGVTQHESMIYFCAAMVYDAGFLSIDPELLSAENLTVDQHKELNRHVDNATEHLQFVPKRYWEVFENAARLHHENIDGSGMPEGLKGDEIPKIAKIIRGADSYIALSSRRSYRGGTDKESAVAKLEEQPNVYDMDVVNALKDII